MTEPVRIAVDAHGGDHGCDTVIAGVVAALRDASLPCIVHLCGKSAEVVAAVARSGGVDLLESGRVVVEDCPETVPGSVKASLAWKRYPRSSVVRCLALQSEGVTAASLSAGDTRFLMGGAVFLLGRKRGISRPALAALIPTTRSRPTLVLDVGANVGCKPDFLADFGVMGWHYMQRCHGAESPVVKLLNVGGESYKGTRVVLDAAALLQKRLPVFGGFIEGSEVLQGAADVVVCDGFPGNVLLKVCESFHGVVGTFFGDTLQSAETASRIAMLDAEQYGAVPLLGIQGIVFKAHGASSSRAFAFAVKAAVRAVGQGLGTLAFA